MGKREYARSAEGALSQNAAAQIGALREAMKGGHPKLRAMRMELRDEVELAKAAVKKKKNRDKNKAARASRKKAR